MAFVDSQLELRSMRIQSSHAPWNRAMFCQTLVLFVPQLLFVAFSAATLNDILLTVPDRTTPLSSKIVASFLEKYFGAPTSDVKHISLVTQVIDDPPIYDNTISHLLHLIQAQFTYRFLNNLRGRAEYVRASVVIFLITDYRSWKRVSKLFVRDNFSTDLYYLIVFTQMDDGFTATKLDEIFNNFYQKALLNVNVLFPHTNDSMMMSTYIPFEHDCVKLTRHDLGILTGNEFTLSESFDDVFPIKASNMNKCTLIVGTFPSEPHVIVKSKNETTFDVEVDGIEVLLLRQMAESLNFTVRFRSPADQQKRGVIHLNGTTTGCMNMVRTGAANLTVGTYGYNLKRNIYLTPSNPYSQLVLTFGIPLGDDIQTAIEKLLAPFDLFLWLSLGLCLFGAIYLILLSKQLDRDRRHFVIGGRANRTPIFNMTVVLLGGGIGNPRMTSSKFIQFSTFARTLTVIWFLITMVLRGSYQGALFSFLQQKIIASPYETISKIFRSDCQLIIMATAATSLDVYNVDKSRYILYNYSQQIAFRKMHDNELDGVVYCNDMQLGYFNFLNSNKRRLQMPKDRLYLMPVVIYFPKYTFLPSLFNSKLTLFAESGLLDYWSGQYIDERKNRKHQKRGPTPLKIRNIVGVLEICSVLLAVSFIVVCLEVLSQKFTILKRSIEYFTY